MKISSAARRTAEFGFLGLAAALALTACAAPAQKAAAREHQAEEKEAAAIASAVNSLNSLDAQTQNDYKINGADLLSISVYQDSDLDRNIRVSQEGEISFPLAGAIKVGGLSVIEAEQALADKLSHYLVNPQVSIFIKEYGNKQIYVLGEVREPGAYLIPVGSNLTVLGAVSMAKGFTMVAAPDRTRVIRNVAGKNETLTVPVSEITKEGDKDKDVPLRPNDIIYVPQSYF